MALFLSQFLGGQFRPFSGGQFKPFLGGQFKPFSGGQFKPGLGGQFDRFVHQIIYNYVKYSKFKKRRI